MSIKNDSTIVWDFDNIKTVLTSANEYTFTASDKEKFSQFKIFIDIDNIYPGGVFYIADVNGNKIQIYGFGYNINLAKNIDKLIYVPSASFPDDPAFTDFKIALGN